MLNPKFVRNNPELVKTKLQTRKVDPAEVDEYLQLDQQNRDAITKVEGLKKQKNQLTEQIGQSDPQSEAGQPSFNKSNSWMVILRVRKRPKRK